MECKVRSYYFESTGFYSNGENSKIFYRKVWTHQEGRGNIFFDKDMFCSKQTANELLNLINCIWIGKTITDVNLHCMQQEINCLVNRFINENLLVENRLELAKTTDGFIVTIKKDEYFDMY